MTSTIQRFEPNNGLAKNISQATAIEQSRAVAEVQAAVIVAQNVPRDMQRAIAEMRESCGRMAMAEQAFYAVPNRGTGASVHLARELARIWGNIEHGSHELRREDDAGVSEVQAFAWDKQTNTRTSRTFIAPHERMKGGARQRLTDLGDIQNNNNNVAARAVRECILNVLPRWFTEEAQNICRNTLEHGEGKPLSQRIDEMVNAFKGIGISGKQIESKLEKKRGQFDAGDVAQMGIVYTSITRDGLSKDEVFPPEDAETVADIVGADSAVAEGKPKRGAARIGGKVKDAGLQPSRGEIEAEVVAAAVSTDQAESNMTTTPPEENSPEPDNEQVDAPGVEGDNSEKPFLANVTPGAPTDSTPGQTASVDTALEKARANAAGNARAQLVAEIDGLFFEAGCAENPGDILTVISSILKIGIKDAAALNLSQLKTVRTSLLAWKNGQTLADMIARILDTADMQAESLNSEES